MRKFFTALLLTASLPAFAGIAEDVKNDIPAAAIAKSAVESCAGNAGCLETALKEMLDAGLTLEVVATAAASAGIGIATFTNAAKSAGFDGGSALVAFQNASLAINAPASGPAANGEIPGKTTDTNAVSGSNNRAINVTPIAISPTKP
ncbi:MAG: hypothetical protein JKY50_19035 [Oleispira sp.]|nr:hypothetical protein [Oleispira sp.]